jgi:hypothetical protein
MFFKKIFFECLPDKFIASLLKVTAEKPAFTLHQIHHMLL